MTTIKLAFASDLHLPITSREAIAALAREVADFGPDALVLAGDLAESLRDLADCLGAIRRQVTAPVLVLPGNHDLWARDFPSRSKWDYRLAQVVAEAGCVWLEGSAWTHEGFAVAGTIGWYDYSARDPQVTASAEEFAREKKHYNPDAYEIDWSWSDREFARIVAKPFLETLDRLEADGSVLHVLVATHMPLVECQMSRNSGNPDWAFSNAYFGNLTLGEQVLAHRKVTHIISGHTHAEKRGRVELPQGRMVDAVVIPSEYDAPSWVQLTLRAAAETIAG